MKPGRTPPGTPPSINKPTVRYSDANSVSKSELPRPQTPFHKPLTAKDVTSPAFIEKVVEILNGDNDKTEVIQSLPAPVAANKALNPPIPDKAPNQLKPNAAPMASPLIENSGNLANQVNSMFPPPPSTNGAPIRPDSSPPIMPNEAPKPTIPMLPQAPSTGGGLLSSLFFNSLVRK